jgi:hypothetical protein
MAYNSRPGLSNTALARREFMTTFLNVPYAEKDEARSLGARWNPTRKSWYVPSGVALEPFEKWIKEGAAAAPKGRVDTFAAKQVVGKNYVELEHDCSPFEACAQCAPKLEESGWAAAQASVLQALGKLAR